MASASASATAVEVETGSGGAAAGQKRAQEVDTECNDVPLLSACIPCAGDVWRPLFSLRYLVSRLLCMRTPVPVPGVHESLADVVIAGGLFAGFIAAVYSAKGGGGGGSGDAEGTGRISDVAMMFCFILGTRNSLATALFGVSFERALWFHKAFALIAIVTGALHGAWAENNGSGVGLLVVMMLMVALAFYPIRRFLFEVFYGSHWLLAIFVIIFAVAHGCAAFGFGILMWVVDIVARLFFVSHKIEATVYALPSDVLRITFPRSAWRPYSAGQYVFICCPSLSIMDFHPFSISSSPHHDEVTIHVRVLGGWTKALYQKCSGNAAASDTAERHCKMTFLVEGPYGRPAVDIENPDTYKVALLISGGIGVTPLQSICNSLLYQANNGRPLKKIFFCWAVRDKYMVDAMLAYDRSYEIPARLPLSFIPDLLDRHGSSRSLELDAQGTSRSDDGADSSNVNDNADDDEVLHTEFYLSRIRNEHDFAEANIRPDVQPSVRFGRPQLPNVFMRAKNYAKQQGESRIAVLVCGPGSMVDETAQLCLKHSETCGVRFDMHGEVFEF